MAGKQLNTPIPPASPPRADDLNPMDRSAFFLAFGEEMEAAAPDELVQVIHDRAMVRVQRFLAARKPSETAYGSVAPAPALHDAPRQPVSPDAAVIALCAQHIRNLEAYNSGGARPAAEDASLWAAYAETRDAIGAAVPKTIEGLAAKALAAKAEARDLAGEERPDGTPATAWAMDLTNDILRLHGVGLTRQSVPPTSPGPTPLEKDADLLFDSLDAATTARADIALAIEVLLHATPDHANAGGFIDTCRLVTEWLIQHTERLETTLQRALALRNTPERGLKASLRAQLDESIAAAAEIELAIDVLRHATPDHANAGGLVDTCRLVTEWLSQHTTRLDTALQEAWALMKTPEHLAHRQQTGATPAG